MAVTDTRPAVEADAGDDTSRRAPGVPERLLGGADHTTIGRLFIVTGLLFFCVAIITRLIVGIDQVTDNGLLGSWLTMVSSSARVFGPISLVAVVFAVPREESTLHVDTLLMSCRVIGRTVEQFLWAAVLEEAHRLGFERVEAEYIPTAKNAQVAALYDGFGLARVSEGDHGVRYAASLPELARPRHFVAQQRS